MVEDASVNHVPVLTGGAGKSALRAFYSVDFIPRMPADTKITPALGRWEKINWWMK